MVDAQPAGGGTTPDGQASMETGRHPLDSFFWPRSIAVVGASEDTKKIRGKVLEVLLQHEFAGPIFPVTPSRSNVRGLPAYPSIRDVPGPIDLALVAVPPETVLPVIEDCAACAVRGAVIFTSGFAEAGGDAARWQERVSEIAAKTGMHICGPNAIGFFNLHGRIACTFSPSAMLSEGLSDHADRAAGRIGVAAQSGGLSFALFNRGLRRRLGFSFVVSSGNEASLQVADFTDYMVEDRRTDVMMLFLESARDGEKLIALARKAADSGKPVVVAKVGRSEAGCRAAASHTASLDRCRPGLRCRLPPLRHVSGRRPGGHARHRCGAFDVPAAARRSRGHRHQFRRFGCVDGRRMRTGRAGNSAARCRDA